MKKLIIIAIIVSIIGTGCRTPKIVYVPVQDSTYVENTTEIDDSYSWTDPDSLLLKFAIECDSNYNAVIKQLHESNSGIKVVTEIKEIEVPVSDNRKINRLEFTLSGYVDSLAMRDRTIRELRYLLESKPAIVEVEKPVRFIPKWIRNCAIGFFVLLALNILAVIMYFRIKK